MNFRKLQDQFIIRVNIRLLFAHKQTLLESSKPIWEFTVYYGMLTKIWCHNLKSWIHSSLGTWGSRQKRLNPGIY